MLDILKGAGKTKSETLDPASIRIDGGTQMRVELSEATVAEYAEAMGNGAIFPPIIVYYDGDQYWLGDGFHRLAAHKRAMPGQPVEFAEVRSGTRRDAVLHAAGANAKHGLRRTSADKRRAVETLLRDEEWALWSDREIARACGVDHKTVGNLRRDLTGEIPQLAAERTYTTKHGTTATMSTTGIASANQERKQAEKSDQIETWLFGKGWARFAADGKHGITKGDHSFTWSYGDERSRFSALKNAEMMQRSFDVVTKANMIQPQPAPAPKPPKAATVQDLVTEAVLQQLHVNLLSARPYIAEAIGQTEKLGHSAWMVQALYLIDMEIKRVEENSNEA